MAISWEELENVFSHGSIDSKVCTRCVQLAAAELNSNSKHYQVSQDIIHQQERYIRMGRSLKGVQCLRIIHIHNGLDEESGHIYDADDVDRIQYTSEDAMPEMYHQWVHTVSNFAFPQPEQNLRKWLHNRLKQSKMMSADITYFDQLPQRHPDRSYSWLFDRWRYRIEQLEREKNRKSFEKTNAVPALVFSR